MDKLTTNRHVSLFDAVISQRFSDRYYQTFTNREEKILDSGVHVVTLGAVITQRSSELIQCIMYRVF
jgi:hypothetical protein